MKKQDIINEIKAAYERYKTIKPEEFSFRQFISNYDANTKCGTVCCLWGWEPKFGVLKGVNWCRFDDITDITKYPSSYFNWGINIIESLYYPDSSNNNLYKNSTLEEVLNHWEKTINTIESGTELDHLLNLDYNEE